MAATRKIGKVCLFALTQSAYIPQFALNTNKNGSNWKINCENERQRKSRRLRGLHHYGNSAFCSLIARLPGLVYVEVKLY
ncbi:unnamed protein product [Cuscuta campestris]|uniref:Uncharacterized protein n=1 Tax=Cuscuta campestris TaxID=132261 RepID=A0A484N5G4_9ASTE|nr:unnamed protein product [Cuscuta campestris]